MYIEYVLFLECVHLPVQTHVCLIDLRPHVKDDLGTGADSIPCLDWLACLPEVERDLEYLELFTSGLQTFLDFLSIALVNKRGAGPCIVPLAED